MSSTPIFMRLILAFLVVLSPIFLVMLVIVDKGKDDLRLKMSESIMDGNRHALYSLEYESQRSQRLMHEFILDQDLLELAINGKEMGWYERIEKIKLIQRRMKLVKQSSPLNLEMKTYVPSLDRTILSEEYQTTINEPEFMAMSNIDGQQKGLWRYWDDRVWIQFQYGGTLDAQPLFTQSIELSLPQIRQTLSNINRSLGGMAAFINTSEGWDISSENGSELRPLLLSHLRASKNESGMESITYDNESFLTAYQYSPILGGYLVVIVPEEIMLGEINKYEGRLWILFIVALPLIVAFSYMIYLTIHKPLRKLLTHFERMKHGHFHQIEIPDKKSEFTYLYKGFNEMVERLEDLMNEVHLQKGISQLHELKRLQLQINPHFLYNCLFVLNQLILSHDTQVAYRFSLAVGRYFQFLTKDGTDEIPLEMEINHSRTYVEIQKICFGERVHISFSGSIPLGTQIVPRLILQPIIENSFKYAFGKISKKEGKLHIHAAKEEDFLIIFVEDNGNVLTDAQIRELNERIIKVPELNEDISGLQNVHRRIRLKFGQDSGIFLNRSSLGGLQVIVKFHISQS